MKYLMLVLLLVSCDRLQGPAGKDGKNGVDGRDGSNGQNGSNGTVVTPIQLCNPNFVPTYPSVFPEFAICLGNQLYGVYSTNGGFLAVLPPGQYNSNGINASCTFRVSANCIIQD